MSSIPKPIAIPPSCVKSGNPHLNPGRWIDCNLVRWDGGSLVPVGGWQMVLNVLSRIPAATNEGSDESTTDNTQESSGSTGE